MASLIAAGDRPLILLRQKAERAAAWPNRLASCRACHCSLRARGAVSRVTTSTKRASALTKAGSHKVLGRVEKAPAFNGSRERSIVMPPIFATIPGAEQGAGA